MITLVGRVDNNLSLISQQNRSHPHSDFTEGCYPTLEFEEGILEEVKSSQQTLTATVISAVNQNNLTRAPEAKV